MIGRLLLAGFVALASASAALAQASGIDVQQQNMGPASELPRPIAQMSASDMQAYETGLRNGVVRGWEEGGVTVAPDDVSLSSDIIPAGGGLKIVRTKVIVRGKSFQWVFMGAAGDKIMGVFCTAENAQPFEPAGTECASRVKQVFGGN